MGLPLRRNRYEEIERRGGGGGAREKVKRDRETEGGEKKRKYKKKDKRERWRAREGAMDKRGENERDIRLYFMLVNV